MLAGLASFSWPLNPEGKKKSVSDLFYFCTAQSGFGEMPPSKCPSVPSPAYLGIIKVICHTLLSLMTAKLYEVKYSPTAEIEFTILL